MKTVNQQQRAEFTNNCAQLYSSLSRATNLKIIFGKNWIEAVIPFVTLSPGDLLKLYKSPLCYNTTAHNFEIRDNSIIIGEAQKYTDE